MFEPFNANGNSPNATNNAIDEWTLSVALGSNLTAAMTDHYETFIVRLGRNSLVRASRKTAPC